MDILDDARSFPSLWKVTQSYLNKYPESLHPNSNLEWILSDEPMLPMGHSSDAPLYKQRDYNGCQFFSNFESKYNFTTTHVNLEILSFRQRIYNILILDANLVI